MKNKLSKIYGYKKKINNLEMEYELFNNIGTKMYFLNV